MDLTIAIISYNTRDLLLACLQSIQDMTKDVEYELIVIDNASSDGSAAAVRAQFPQARVIANQDNGGYAKACNQAVNIGRGQYVLFLNSDTVMRTCTLSRMVACLDTQPDIGAVSCLQCNEAGRVLQSCFPFPSVRDHLRYSAWVPTIIKRVIGGGFELDSTVSQDVDWANGACLMVRRSLLQQLGGLDEAFFMYFEDVDLCRRLRQYGCRVRHLAEAEIIHFIGCSSGRDRERLQLVWEFSRICYIEKHFSPIKRWIMKGWIAGGAGWRLAQSMWCAPAAQRRMRAQSCLTTIRRLWSGPQLIEQVRAYSSGPQG